MQRSRHRDLAILTVLGQVSVELAGDFDGGTVVGTS